MEWIALISVSLVVLSLIGFVVFLGFAAGYPEREIQTPLPESRPGGEPQRAAGS
jgi:hypothetical protein